jgi:hypothetical protein
MTEDTYGAGKPFDGMNTRGLTAKREYVRELERRGDTEAIARLAECLKDESAYQRDLAEQSLMRLGAAGVKALMPLLAQGLWYTRSSAARTLGRMGSGDAVPALFGLTEDANDTVASASREALVEIGRQRGAIRLAHALHRMPPDRRGRRMDEIGTRDPVLGERLERLLRSDELMGVDDVSVLTDDSAAVRDEGGVEWEALTGPPSGRSSPGDAGGGRA